MSLATQKVRSVWWNKSKNLIDSQEEACILKCLEARHLDHTSAIIALFSPNYYTSGSKTIFSWPHSYNETV